jgi:hypothetical protein
VSSLRPESHAMNLSISHCFYRHFTLWGSLHHLCKVPDEVLGLDEGLPKKLFHALYIRNTRMANRYGYRNKPAKFVLMKRSSFYELGEDLWKDGVKKKLEIRI